MDAIALRAPLFPLLLALSAAHAVAATFEALVPSQACRRSAKFLSLIKICE
jgi:hypothetical protein